MSVNNPNMFISNKVLFKSNHYLKLKQKKRSRSSSFNIYKMFYLVIYTLVPSVLGATNVIAVPDWQIL